MLLHLLYRSLSFSSGSLLVPVTALILLASSGTLFSEELSSPALPATAGNSAELGQRMIGRQLHSAAGYDTIVSGNVKTVFNKQDRKIRYVYDGDHHLRIKTACSAGCIIQKTTLFHYDSSYGNFHSGSSGIGMLSEVEDVNALYRYRYDSNGRLEEETIRLNDPDLTMNNLFSIRYRYSEDNRINAVVLPDSSQISYYFDEKHRVSRITFRSAGRNEWTVAEYDYSAADLHSVDIRYGNGIHTRRSIPKTGMNETSLPAGSGYNTLSRNNAGDPAYSRAPANVSTMRGDEEKREFIFDVENRLVAINENNHTIMSYAYDWLGNRLCQVSADGRKQFHLSPWYRLESLHAGRETIRKVRIHAPEGLIAEVSSQNAPPESIRYYIHGQSGNNTVVTDGKGNTIETAKMPYFEQADSITGHMDTQFPQVFTIREFDEKSGRFYTCLRYNDPVLKQFAADYTSSSVLTSVRPGQKSASPPN